MTVPGVRLRSGVASDQAARETNEDTAWAADGLYLVADGMGGHEAGEVASRLAVEVVRELAGSTPTMDDVTRVVRDAHRRVRDLPAEGERRPGTTITGVVVTEHAGVPCWLVLNVGDSRTYRMVGGMLEQLTRDHSEVAELVEQGLVAVEDAARHPRRHVVTRVLGGGASRVDPDLRMFPVSHGDRMVVCSDGLTEALSDARVQAVLRTERHPRAAAERLVREALAADAQDNVTVVVVDAVTVHRESSASEPADMAR
ncbi:PP2C family protein-serine/threonine phosphatase [Cellulomonas xiejunii]|uniref:Protein phosphatase 2C domain-containing protein n=1 Tax=Cellulomonas xiejunii TaxID=2968083 RepID=A0ABY5KM75_9CELL|nr:protein phosphatase 2C domain-containing protein [Cellulomonas xiejunii]MCC2320540.1 protein phosphatase 2C domain-containing protein [Cellulomonas xiejunii]UUI70833.1 protein phosphatase 2C domain-containing protein [Cellulomonas xiejunii]